MTRGSRRAAGVTWLNSGSSAEKGQVVRLWPRVVGLLLASGLLTPAAAAWASDQQTFAHSVSAPAKPVPPKQWGRDVCTAVKDWVSTVEDAEASLDSDVEAASSPSQVKDSIVNFVGTIVQATDTLLEETRQAGVPKFKDGNKVSQIMKGGFNEIRNLFAEAQDTLNTADANDQAQFQAAASEVEATITEGVEEVEQTFERAERKYKSASRALDHPACQEET